MILFTKGCWCQKTESIDLLHSKSTFIRYTITFLFSGATYVVHRRLIEKLLVDFLLVILELFCWVLRLRRYERISIQSRRFSRGRSIWPKISGRRGNPHQPFAHG